MSGFDRIKPPERRLLERDESRQPDSREADPKGRAALFSASEAPTTPGAGVRRGKVSTRATSPAHPSTTAGPLVDHPLPKRSSTPAPQPGVGRQPAAPRSARGDGAPTSSDDPRLPQEPSPLTVECGHCGVSCPLPLGHAVRQAMPLVLLAPWKSHLVFAICPCGERRAWLKPRLGLSR